LAGLEGDRQAQDEKDQAVAVEDNAAVEVEELVDKIHVNILSEWRKEL
jgi:hypothetical protein